LGTPLYIGDFPPSAHFSFASIGGCLPFSLLRLHLRFDLCLAVASFHVTVYLVTVSSVPFQLFPLLRG
jgi:hypothetical protein